MSTLDRAMKRLEARAEQLKETLRRGPESPRRVESELAALEIVLMWIRARR